ncbi:hypothetical protein [Haliangium sp.]|uniref:hypothetical protein n=1 Tax=Haliangium sp. TaxID=2663208 RepID=UPI003D139C0A
MKNAAMDDMAHSTTDNGARTAPTTSRLAAAASLSLVLLATGCPRTPTPQDQSGPSERVSSFSEGSPVRALIAIPPHVFTASASGLDRWHLDTGQNLQLSAEHGLPGDRVESIAYEPSRSWLWIATEAGLTRYENQSGSFAEIPPPPQVLGLLPLTEVVVEPAGDGGVWLGHPRGLYYTNPGGQWTETPIRDRVTALHRSRDGWLWIGTDTGLIALRPEGESYRYDKSQGCDLVQVTQIVTAPDDVPLVIGDNAEGQQRIAFLFDKRCVTYRSQPGERWLSASPRDGALLILTERRLYSLGPPSEDSAPGGLRLTPEAWAADTTPVASPARIAPIDGLAVPPGARLVAGTPGEILVGTRSLGAARLSPGRPVTWLRRSELVDDASLLTVACRAPTDCVLGTGNRGWHFDGTAFTLVPRSGGIIVAFARSPEGEIYAVVRTAAENQLVVERIDADSWNRVAGATVETPGIRSEVGFTRFAPDGTLWIGLGYRDDDGTYEPFGVAHIDVSKGSVSYHRKRRRRRRQRGSLPIPPAVTDVTFLDQESWLASPEGAVRVRGDEVEIFKEKDGLATELVRGIAASPGGLVFIASRVGVGAYDGERWTYPPSLDSPVNDVEVTPDGRLWMATKRGLIVYDGADTHRITVGEGLLENQLDEVAIDHHGRVWVRGSQGISLIEP